MNRSTRHILFAALLAAPAAGLGSCNIVGPAAYLAMGQPKVDAAYELQDRPTLVYVDDRTNAIPQSSSQIRRSIADQVSTQLMGEEILTKTISSRDAMALARQHDRAGKLLSIEALGEAVGAEQVIYVEMVDFRGSADGVTPRPTAACRVKVIDVANHVRLCPPADAPTGWHDVAVTSDTISVDRYRTSTGRREIEQMLALLLADRVAKTFYRHVPDEIGTRLQPR